MRCQKRAEGQHARFPFGASCYSVENFVVDSNPFSVVFGQIPRRPSDLCGGWFKKYDVGARGTESGNRFFETCRGIGIKRRLTQEVLFAVATLIKDLTSSEIEHDVRFKSLNVVVPRIQEGCLAWGTGGLRRSDHHTVTPDITCHCC